MFLATLFVTARKWEQFKHSASDRRYKCVTFTQMSNTGQ